MSQKVIALLTAIVILGAFLRLFGLDRYPPGVTADEIQQGYTAYSILTTGRDEWGDILPINPRGFGDYKPPMYSYLAIPSEVIFGLNIFSVRLPAALSGILTILVTFFLARKLFSSSAVGLTAAFLLSTSPWHIHYSRLGFESGLGVLLFSLGVLFLVKSFKEKKGLLLSAVFFGLTLFTYHSFRVFTILFLAGVVVCFWRELRRFEKRVLWTSAAVFLIFAVAVFWGVLFSGAGKRASDAAIYNVENLAPLRVIQVEDKLPDPWRLVVNNKWQYIASSFANNYLGYFSPVFLFSPDRSDSTVFNLPGQGLLYVWEAALLILALYLVVRFREPGLKIMILWLGLAPVPAALTRDFMHAQRVETFLPLLSILSAFALIWLFKIFPRKNMKIMAVVISLVVVWSLVGRFDRYLFHTFNRDLGGLKYGYQEAVSYLRNVQDSYDQIVFTKSNSQPQIFVAFYNQMDPVKFQRSAQEWKYFESAGFKYLDMIDYRLGKYNFRNINWDSDKNLVNTLLVGTPGEIPADVPTKFTVKDPRDKPVFLVVDTNDIN